MINESETRKVRVYAQDLSDGDVVVGIDGTYLGTIETPPDIDYGGDEVKVTLFTGEAYESKTWPVNRVVRIEIPRRVG